MLRPWKVNLSESIDPARGVPIYLQIIQALIRDIESGRLPSGTFLPSSRDLAARLDPKSLQSVGDGACPSCGGAPTATVLINSPHTPGARYCSCSLCGTLWNYVRSKCTLCGSTRKILFQEIEGAGNIKAETCDDCHGYMKVLNHQKDDRLDPVADDVATLGLDLLVRELGFRRGGVNPFLIGY